VAGAGRLASLVVAAALCAPAWSAAATPADSARDGAEKPAPAVPSVDFTMLAGLALPTCSGQAEACSGSLGVGPSMQALVLFQPMQTWSIGVVGQLSRSHWQGSFIGMTDGAPHGVASELTTGFLGLASRIVFLPGSAVSPVMQLALASAFQTQTGSNFNCNDGLAPTGQLGLGAKARVSRSFAVFAIASASAGVKLAGDCVASDGPPTTPFAAWGFGLHFGASFDVPLGGASSGASLAAR
jgi:hypothetical protein